MSINLRLSGELQMPLLGRIFNRFKIRLEERHYSSGSNSTFSSGHESFAAYISSTREMLHRVRSYTTDADKLQQSVEGNAPFALEPGGSNTAGKQRRWRRGILLTHGLSDSPYCMRHLAACFQENGYRVLAILLPGHGTRPGDLLEVSWQEWASSVAFGVDQLAAEVDEVYMGGYSAGGALSIYHSMRDNRVRGLFLFSPAVQISPWAALVSLYKLVSWIFPKAKWLEIKLDRDLYKYESFTNNNVQQMHALTQVLKRQKMERLNIPVFCVASEVDKTVNAKATVGFMAMQFNPCNKLILYTGADTVLSRAAMKPNVELLECVDISKKILGSAHTAIVIPPEDKHYGVNGDYANCLHYYPNDMKKYDACTASPKECWKGEITQANLKAGLLCRLMYNPHFAEMKKSLDFFIGSLPRSGS